jgi:hypothetical protein
VGRYTFNEQDGVDTGSEGIDLTITGATATMGYYGPNYDFDGNDYLRNAGAGDYRTNDFNGVVVRMLFFHLVMWAVLQEPLNSVFQKVILRLDSKILGLKQ